ncbi:MAG TPA: CmpA/NrtA family ABC transporter substrate-binding protein [Rhodopila sp.]|nr:CmpA/NrtA family ABC transporter substrate-binding protein [Rhodopila sp.]
MNQTIRVGLLRLVDSAPMVVAQSRGLFSANGLDVAIGIEPSWSNIVDKLTHGLLDAAVMLPPLALAACAGLRGSRARLIVPLSLSQGGNTITVASDAAVALSGEAQSIGLLEWLRAQPTKPRFAVVHAFSTHNLLLRYWLAASGVDPDTDIETAVIPPEDVVEALADGAITGFCAGAPWGSVAEERGVGRVLLGTSSIWPFHPEKCLCVGQAWAEASPNALCALLRSVLRAQVICDDPAQADGIAELLAAPDGLRLPQAASRAALPGGHGRERIRFHEHEAWFPAHAHAQWFLAQMHRWGWLDPNEDLAALTAQVYRPDLLAPAVEAERLHSVTDLPALERSAMLPRPQEPAFDNGLRRR